MKRPDLPLEVVLVCEAFAQALGVSASDFWAIVYRERPAPPGWASSWSAAFSKVLQNRKQSSRVNVTDMTESHAMAISKSRRGKKRDAFTTACHDAGLTQNGLAAKLGISTASLSRYRDDRPVPRAIADKVKTLIGFAGTWPGGIVD